MQTSTLYCYLFSKVENSVQQWTTSKKVTGFKPHWKHYFKSARNNSEWLQKKQTTPMSTTLAKIWGKFRHRKCETQKATEIILFSYAKISLKKMRTNGRVQRWSHLSCLYIHWWKLILNVHPGLNLVAYILSPTVQLVYFYITYSMYLINLDDLSRHDVESTQISRTVVDTTWIQV